MTTALPAHGSLAFAAGSWYYTDPVGGQYEVPADLLCFVAQLLSHEGGDVAAAIRATWPGNEEAALAYLHDIGLAPANGPVQPLSAPDPALRDFLALGRSVIHADYSRPEAMVSDERTTRERYGQGDYPHEDAVSGNQLTYLDHPAWNEAGRPIEHWLFWTCGSLRRATFFDVLPARLKAVPSKGARHPFRFFVANEGGSDLAEYVPDEHALVARSEQLDSPIRELVRSATGPRTTVVLVALEYETYQWRYRDSGWPYKDLAIELGHLAEHMRFTARALSIALDLRMLPRMPPLRAELRLRTEIHALVALVESPGFPG